MQPALLDKFETIFAANRRAGFSGVVNLADASGELLFARASGWANRSDRLRNRITTRFAAASGSKLFTAVTVLRLVQEGRLNLDQPVAGLLADFPFGPHVTVRHLLTHTSGLPDYFDEEEAVEIDSYALLWEQRPVYAMQSARDFLPLFYSKTPKTLPGERFAYNNAAFLLLELVIERAGGLPFREAVRRAIFDPAGMADSGYFYTDRLPAHTALGYIPLENRGWRTNIFAVPYIGGGDGGAYVTAADWTRFWLALTGAKLLGAELVAEMLCAQAQSHPLPGRFYGLGVWLLASPLPRAAMAVGSDPGADMVSLHLLERGLTLNILSNQSDGAGRMYKELLHVLSVEGGRP